MGALRHLRRSIRDLRHRQKKMKGVGKIEVILSWDDDNYCCQFRRGRDQESWQGMSRDEQARAVGAMFEMGRMFLGHIKEEQK